MEEENLNLIKNNPIRRQWDEKTEKWYFSIVDIIALTTKSTDPRNYWKVLKNRLKKGQNELVTECNQLKMRSHDGKFYLTDTADEATILKLMQIISPEHFPSLQEFLANLGDPFPENVDEADEKINVESPQISDPDLSYPQTNLKNKNEDEKEDEEFMLMIDGYVEKNHIILKAFTAGTQVKNLSILITDNVATIKGERRQENQMNIVKSSVTSFDQQELYWGKFSRSIKLPHEVVISEVKSTEKDGLLTITLPLLNVNFSKIIEARKMRTI